MLVVLGLVGSTWHSAATGRLPVDARLTRATRLARRWARGLHIRVGVDFRGRPPYPRRVPGRMLALAVPVVAVCAAVASAPATFPHGLRDWLVPKSSFLYLLVTAAVWTWAVVAAFGGTFLLWLLLSDRVLEDGPATRRQNLARFWLPWVWTATAGALAVLAPVWVPSLVLSTGLALSLLTLVFPSAGEIRLLWKEERTQEVFSLGSRWLYAWGLFLCFGVTLATVLPMTRSGWDGDAGGPTVWLGTTVGWLAAAGATAWLWRGPLRLLRLSVRDPADGETPTPVRFIGPAPVPEVVDVLEARGFRVVEGDSGHAVPVRLQEEPGELEVGAAQGGWTGPPRDLLLPGALAELRTLDRERRRAEVVGALRRLMAVGRARTFEYGSGFWFAPHLWHMWGMGRDTDEADSTTVGPPYHRILSVDARRHCLEVFRATSIDIVFIEDGVGEEAVANVIMQLFEHFDVWGVHPAEESRFRPVPGAHVIIHDLSHESPFRRPGYRAPSYEEIGRGRILHVMRSRGGEREQVDPVQEPVRTPAVLGRV